MRFKNHIVRDCVLVEGQAKVNALLLVYVLAMTYFTDINYFNLILNGIKNTTTRYLIVFRLFLTAFSPLLLVFSPRLFWTPQ